MAQASPVQEPDAGALMKLVEDPDRIVTQKEFAGIVNCSRQNVGKAIGSRLTGRALVERQGKPTRLHLGEALRQWNDDVDVRGGLPIDAPTDEPAPANGQAAPAETDLAESGAIDPDTGEVKSYKDWRAEEARERTLALRDQRLERQNRLRDVFEMAEAMATCGREQRKAVEQIESWNEEMAAEFGIGPNEARAWLQKKSRELQERLAQVMTETQEREDENNA